MIIESSFLKLPELLSNSYFTHETFEATVVHLFSTSILMELNSKNIPHHLQHVITEKPYPFNRKLKKNARSDIFVNLTSAFHSAVDLSDYGIRDLNWIEVKSFFSSIKKNSKPPSTSNIGKIIRDILRVCVLPEELQGKIRQNGRYILLIFSDSPFKSLALTSKKAERTWLKKLLSEGTSEITLELDNETKSLKQEIGSGFLEPLNFILNLKFRTTIFVPDIISKHIQFFGYLIRIREFSISLLNNKIVFNERPNDYWDKLRINQLRLIRQEIFKRM